MDLQEAGGKAEGVHRGSGRGDQCCAELVAGGAAGALDRLAQAPGVVERGPERFHRGAGARGGPLDEPAEDVVLTLPALGVEGARFERGGFGESEHGVG
jgi:hypothetical protein